MLRVAANQSNPSLVPPWSLLGHRDPDCLFRFSTRLSCRSLLLLLLPFLFIFFNKLPETRHLSFLEIQFNSNSISACICICICSLRPYIHCTSQRQVETMALQSAYKQFLAAPNSSFLSSDASLHYITTLTSIKGSAEIIKYLNGQSHELKKNEEKFLDVVEGANNLAAEIHTTVEFVSGGGAYLPSLDDNFLADRIVTLPIVGCLGQITKASLTLLDPHRLLRWQRQDPTNPTKLGPGIASQVDRCYWQDWAQLANP